MSDRGFSRDVAFRLLLLDISNQLGDDEVAALKFLCADLLPTKKLQDVTSAEKLFERLVEQDMIDQDNLFLVAELLYRIRQHYLLRKLHYTKEAVQAALPTRSTVSEYRQLLFDISEDIGKADHEAFIFLLPDVLRKKHRESMSTLDLLTHLEAQDLLSPDKLDKFENICKEISPELVKKITKYKEEQVTVPSQESSPSLRITSSQEETVTGACSNSLPAPLSFPCQTTDINDTTLTRQAEVRAIENVDHSFSELSLEQPSEEYGLDGAAEECAVYRMGETCRGICVIINNELFGKNIERRGSKQDAAALQNIFTWLGLKVAVYENLTAAEILTCLEKVQTELRLKEWDCFVCCILSHGESGSIHGSDDQLLPIRTLTSYFTGRRCPSLVNKPKLFFIQACQGKDIQPVVVIESDAQYFQGPPIIGQSIPDEADFLLGMATVNGFASFRNVKVGSWYIQSLCRNLETQVPRKEDILSILLKVNDEVSKEVDGTGLKKQMPQPAYTLRKKVIFPVPKIPLPNLTNGYP